MIRYMKSYHGLIAAYGGFGERRHRVGGELTGGRERGIAGIGLVEPGLRGGAIGRRQRLQFAPRLGEIVAQRHRRDPRDHRAAVAADGVGALDANELGRTRLQPIDDARTGRRGLRRRRRQFRHQRQQFAAQAGGVRHAGSRKTLERLQGIRIGRKGFRSTQRRGIGIAGPDQNVEQGRRHDAAQRHIVGRLAALPS